MTKTKMKLKIGEIKEENIKNFIEKMIYYKCGGSLPFALSIQMRFGHENAHVNMKLIQQIRVIILIESMRC